MPTSATTRELRKNDARIALKRARTAQYEPNVVNVTVFTDSHRVRRTVFSQMNPDVLTERQTDRGHHLSVYKHTSVHREESHGWIDAAFPVVQR